MPASSRPLEPHPSSPRRALLVGNSDGIGRAATRRLLDQGWEVLGVSRREAPIVDPHYRHAVLDVAKPGFTDGLRGLVGDGPLDLCVYCAGIGEALDRENLGLDVRTFEVNLTGLVRTASVVLPPMVRRAQGHLIGLSSLADELISSEAPAYAASKAGFSSYLAGLARALRPRGVAVTTLRFGFVDTKMAKGPVRPFLLTVDQAVDHVERCMRHKPMRYTTPKVMIPVVKVLKVLGALRRG